jgi:hypothetical protein
VIVFYSIQNMFWFWFPIFVSGAPNDQNSFLFDRNGPVLVGLGAPVRTKFRSWNFKFSVFLVELRAPHKNFFLKHSKKFFIFLRSASLFQLGKPSWDQNYIWEGFLNRKSSIWPVHSEWMDLLRNPWERRKL